MVRRRDRWRKTLLRIILYPKRLSLAALSLWPTRNHGRKDSLSHGWDVLIGDHEQKGPLIQGQPRLTPTPPTTSDNCEEGSDAFTADIKEVAIHTQDSDTDLAFALDPLPFEVSRRNSKCLTLGDIPFSFTTRCAPSELPEDVEWTIFNMAARNNPVEALHTLVFVNHRIRKWVEYIIYESVILRDAKHARRFLDGLECKHPDFATGAVKILALPTRVSYDTSFKILSICKNVQHLSWLPTNPLSSEIVELISNIPLISLRARLTSFAFGHPDFSTPLFNTITTLFVADHQSVWKDWKWDTIKKQPKLKWLAFNVDGRLMTNEEWAPVHTLERTLVKPYGGPKGIRLCVCYNYRAHGMGDRWIHRSEMTFSEELMAVLSLDHRMDEWAWEKRVNGEMQDFEISEGLVGQRQTQERRLRFELHRTSLTF